MPASSAPAAPYALFHRARDARAAAQCAVWLAITYKANFANFVAADGWISRAEDCSPLEPGPGHGWVWVAKAYRSDDLDGAEDRAGRSRRRSGPATWTSVKAPFECNLVVAHRR